MDEAGNLAFVDFEGAVLYQAACNAAVDGLATRNIKDLKQALLPRWVF